MQVTNPHKKNRNTRTMSGILYVVCPVFIYIFYGLETIFSLMTRNDKGGIVREYFPCANLTFWINTPLSSIKLASEPTCDETISKSVCCFFTLLFKSIR